ncbi:hypothetical protein HK104_003353, partial [Borealophlyctis nickersoniae]
MTSPPLLPPFQPDTAPPSSKPSSSLSVPSSSLSVPSHDPSGNPPESLRANVAPTPLGIMNDNDLHRPNGPSVPVLIVEPDQQSPRDLQVDLQRVVTWRPKAGLRVVNQSPDDDDDSSESDDERGGTEVHLSNADNANGQPATLAMNAPFYGQSYTPWSNGDSHRSPSDMSAPPPMGVHTFSNDAFAGYPMQSNPAPHGDGAPASRPRKRAARLKSKVRRVLMPSRAARAFASPNPDVDTAQNMHGGGRISAQSASNVPQHALLKPGMIGVTAEADGSIKKMTNPPARMSSLTDLYAGLVMPSENNSMARSDAGSVNSKVMTAAAVAAESPTNANGAMNDPTNGVHETDRRSLFTHSVLVRVDTTTSSLRHAVLNNRRPSIRSNRSSMILPSRLESLMDDEEEAAVSTSPLPTICDKPIAESPIGHTFSSIPPTQRYSLPIFPSQHEKPAMRSSTVTSVWTDSMPRVVTWAARGPLRVRNSECEDDPVGGGDEGRQFVEKVQASERADSTVEEGTESTVLGSSTESMDGEVVETQEDVSTADTTWEDMVGEDVVWEDIFLGDEDPSAASHPPPTATHTSTQHNLPRKATVQKPPVPASKKRIAARLKSNMRRTKSRFRKVLVKAGAEGSPEKKGKVGGEVYGRPARSFSGPKDVGSLDKARGGVVDLDGPPTDVVVKPDFVERVEVRHSTTGFAETSYPRLQKADPLTTPVAKTSPVQLQPISFSAPKGVASFDGMSNGRDGVVDGPPRDGPQRDVVVKPDVVTSPVSETSPAQQYFPEVLCVETTPIVPLAKMSSAQPRVGEVPGAETSPLTTPASKTSPVQQYFPEVPRVETTPLTSPSSTASPVQPWFPEVPRAETSPLTTPSSDTSHARPYSLEAPPRATPDLVLSLPHSLSEDEKTRKPPVEPISRTFI